MLVQSLLSCHRCICYLQRDLQLSTRNEAATAAALTAAEALVNRLQQTARQVETCRDAQVQQNIKLCAKNDELDSQLSSLRTFSEVKCCIF